MRAVISLPHGIYPVLCTPFGTDQSVDYASIDRLVDALLPVGVGGLVLFGLASEARRLSESERVAITERVAGRTHARLVVVAGADHPSTHGGAHLAALIEAAGADAIMALPPARARSSADDIVAYYQAIEADSPASTFTYRTRWVWEWRRARTAADRNTPVASGASWTMIGAVVAAQIRNSTANGLTVFGGLGGRRFYDELQQGSAGTMVGCAFTQAFVHVWRLWQTGDEAGAERAWRHMFPLLVDDNCLDTFIWCQKVPLARQEILAGYALRAPASMPDDGVREGWLSLVDRIAGEPGGAFMVERER